MSGLFSDLEKETQEHRQECLCHAIISNQRGKMKITVEHGKTKEETIASVDRTFEQMFQGMGGMPVQIVVEQRNWQGDVMNFALTAKMGFFSTPIKGTVTVTERDVTVDVDLGILNQFVSEKAVGEMIGERIRGLLR